MSNQNMHGLRHSGCLHCQSIAAVLAGFLLLAATLMMAASALAKSTRADAVNDYIVQLTRPGVAVAPQFKQVLSAQRASGRRDLRAMPELKTYLNELSLQRQRVLVDAAVMFRRQLVARHEYAHLLNGFAVSLSVAEAAQLAELPEVAGVMISRDYQLHLDAGPGLIGAPDIWNGVNGIPARGEGIVIGIVDSGINWEHPFFAGESADGFVFNNPRPARLGLCADPDFPQVACNDKLIGVYDFTTEADQDGMDQNGHGSHVASIAAGNPLSTNLTINGLAPVTFKLSGVAPRAHIISYKACQAQDDEPPGSPPSCQGQALLDALDQALADGVDVFNFSIGGDAREDPWFYLREPGIQDFSEVFLSMREQAVASVTSAGNSGPGAGSIGAPAVAPWTVAVGNITHGRAQAKTLELLIGGDTPPPADIVGVGASNGTLLREAIVHAKDFGNALCGVGPAELGPSCGDNTGASNPFPPGTFDGEIVVCDRGTYGRIEKGFNVLQAGAGGMILANTDAEGESIISDAHCLPAMHIGDQDGDALRSWLNSGTGHRGRISPTKVINDPGFAGQLTSSSSVGPNAEIAGILKPNLSAPGTNILGASNNGQDFLFLTGTSMASPHITGAFALLKSAHPEWSNNQIFSALETTAIWPLPGSATPAGITADQRGAGVPVLKDAVRAGLYLNVSGHDFRNADPTTGGNPGNLNLPGVQIADCRGECQVSRRLTDMQGGGFWTLSTDSPSLQVSPASINLTAGASATITITARLDDPDLVGQSQSGRVLMTSSNSAGGELTQTLPVSILFSGGELPDNIQISTDQARGRQELSLSGLVALPRANWQPSLLKQPMFSSGVIQPDPTPQDPYDSNAGTRTEFFQVPVNTLQLRAETLSSPAPDVDLFIGMDLNGNGIAEEFEEICNSILPSNIEQCSIDHPQPGEYWIRLQVFEGSASGDDEVRARFAALNTASTVEQQNLFVRAPGVTADDQTIDTILAWDVGALGSNQRAWGVLGVGTSPAAGTNIGLIPIVIKRTGLGTAQALPLFSGQQRRLRLAPGSEHDKTFIDVAENATGLRVIVQGADADAELQLVRVPFAQAFSGQPDVPAAPASRSFTVTADAGGSIDFSVLAGALQSGRWYLIPRNNSGSEASFNIRADLEHDAARTVAAQQTLYARSGDSKQGVDFARVGSFFGLLWYTFDEQGQPIFYNFAGPVPTDGASAFSGMLNTPISDESVQQALIIGRAGLTFVNDTEIIMSYDLLGRSGSELMQAIAGQPTCPDSAGGKFNVNGIWDITPAANGGISMLALAAAQGYIRYFFDDAGVARWLLGDATGSVVANPGGEFIQIRGFCPGCEVLTPTLNTVGSYLYNFAAGEQTGTQTINFNLQAPLSAQRNRVDAMVRFSDAVQCASG